jgi:hypothetical protein
MSKATSLKLPSSVKEAAAELAREDGVSLNQWMASAVAQKVVAGETAESFLRRRADDPTGTKLKEFLARVPDVPPQAGDELNG